MGRQFVLYAVLLLGTSGLTRAEPAAIWVTHDANNTIRSLAPGSVFSVGINGKLGALPSERAEAFPLRTSLAGVAVRVNVAGESRAAFILSTDAYKVRAMLPSDTPVGEGELRITIDGRAYSSIIRVVPRQFAVYTQPPAESWWPRGYLALAHTIDAEGSWSPITLRNTAQPDDLLVLWGTGFGAAVGDEANEPLTGDRSSALEIVIGTEKAQILYAGRSGCCAGIDQIVVRVPSTAEGCFVPVWVRFPGTDEIDQVHTAVGSRAGRCTDLPAEVVDKLDAARALNLGFISLGKVAVFGPAPYIVSPPGTCRLGAVPSGDIEFSYGDYNHSDAGAALNVRTPLGPESWPWSPYLGGYMGPRFAHRPSSAAAGQYTVNNGGGGYNVGPFQATFTVPPISFTWTNEDRVSIIRRGYGLTLTWSGGTPDHGHVLILGGTKFTCVENVQKGTFTVPPYVLSAISSGERIELAIGFQSNPLPLRFHAPGLDFAHASYYVGSSKTVVVE